MGRHLSLLIETPRTWVKIGLQQLNAFPKLVIEFRCSLRSDMIFPKEIQYSFVSSLCLLLTSCANRSVNSPATLVSSCSLDEIAGGSFTPPNGFAISRSIPDMIFRG